MASLCAFASLAFCFWLRKTGRAMADRIAMIVPTTVSSTSENPVFLPPGFLFPHISLNIEDVCLSKSLSRSLL